MPLFQCPTCGRQSLVPMALCEFLLDQTPVIASKDTGEPIYQAACDACTKASIKTVEGDLLDQTVDVIVNAWNRNVIPWWLLIPQGVSGAIKKRAGLTPFRELGKHGPIPLGQAVLTSAGKLPLKGIIHVAGINLLWRASERSIRDSVRNAMQLAKKSGFTSIAFPLVGAGSGGFDQQRALEIMLDELPKVYLTMSVTLVIFKKNGTTGKSRHRRPREEEKSLIPV